MVRRRLASARVRIKPAFIAVTIVTTLLVYYMGLNTNPLSRETDTPEAQPASLYPSLESSINLIGGKTSSGEIAPTPDLNQLTALEEKPWTTRAVPSRAFEPLKKQNGVTGNNSSKGVPTGAMPELTAPVGPLTAVQDEADAGHAVSTPSVQPSRQSRRNKTRTYLTKSSADAASSTKTTTASLYWKFINYTRASLPNRYVSQYTQEIPTRVTRILEVGYFRSGSSFLGQLLSANPRTFYHYEPLRTLAMGVRLQASDSPRGFQYVKDFFDCNFDRHRDFFQLAQSYPHPIKQNTYLWDSCQREPSLCFDTQFLNALCKAATTQVMKVVRLDLGPALQFFLREDPSTSGSSKVIHLVRDPRAIWTSRHRVGWCRRSANCSSAAVLCADMERDLDAYDAFSRHSPGGAAYQVRHEDLATDPYNTTKKMFQALGLPYTAFVRRFIETHTRETDPTVRRNPYTTSKNSTYVAYSWKRKLRSADVKRINRECRNVIRRLGYHL